MLAVDTSVLVRLLARDDAALAQFRAKPALGFSDCLVLEIARKAGHLPLVSFDKSLSRLPDVQRL